MIRRLLIILLLYVVLVWLVVFYLYSGDTKEIVNQGLLWTAGGVALLLLWLVADWVIGWRTRRVAQRPAAARPAGAAAPVAMHEDDAALLNLFREADQRLAQAPDVPVRRALDLPLYLVVGPEGAGKTAVLHNSGVEPTLLAGQALGGGGISPTRVANLWMAQQSLFLEVSGRIFGSDPNRLKELLSRLRPGSEEPKWKSFFKPPVPPVPLRAVLLVLDARDFSGTPELSKLDRAAQQIRERLLAIAGVLGAEFPVYVFFTKLDSLQYFTQFFSRLPEGEAGQVFGALSAENPQGQSQDRVWAEAETKKLNGIFNSLFLRLNERRVLALAQELEPSRKPAIYQFPREFKKIRTTLVQFLVDVFKPDALRAGPKLRGFFFTGTRKAERAAGPDPWNAAPHAMGGGDVTMIFRPDVTQMLMKAEGSGPLIDKWMFVTDFFLKVLPSDRPRVRHIAKKSGLDQYRQIAIGAAACVCLFFAGAWTISLIQNWSLQSQVQTAISRARQGGLNPNLTNLQALDRLRLQLESLENGESLSMHWGLYTGNSLYPIARKAYFDRLKGLSLDRVNQTLALKLAQAGSNGQDATASVYDRLKTHLTITSLACPVEAAPVLKVLKQTAVEAHNGVTDEQLGLLDLQYNYYVTQLGKKGDMPMALREDPAAVEKARGFLRQSGGVDPQVRALINEVNAQLKPLAVADYADNYKSVLSGPAEMPGAFSKQGKKLFEERVDKGNFGGGSEKCVMGEGLLAQASDLQAGDKIRSRYYRMYADAWRDFIGGFNVIRFANTADAARRLDTLSGSRSPLLGIVSMAAINTNYPPAKAGEQSFLEKQAQNFGLGGLVQAKDKGNKAVEQARQLVSDSVPMSASDIWRLAQPAIVTTPPELDRLVSDNNMGYVTALRGLQASLEAIDRSPGVPERTAAIQQAQAALTAARAAQAGLVDKFTDLADSLSRPLGALLDQPLQWARTVMPAPPPDPGKALPGKKNMELTQFCRAMQPILARYPFNPATDVDVPLTDVAKGFAPNEGLVWKYMQQSGSDLAVKTPQGWQQNPALQGMKVSPELLAFLNRTQQLTSVLFSESGMMQPKLKYVLRPIAGQTIGIKIVMDGETFDSHFPLQKTFYWPAPPGAKPGAEGTVEIGTFSTGFGRFDGTWGVFKLFGNADERPFGTKNVQWSEIRAARGSAANQKLNPPARLEILEFPGGVDLFNPKFFESLQCPARAVVAN